MARSTYRADQGDIMTKPRGGQGARLLTFGEVLTILRARQRLSVAELAELMGWPISQVQAIERGHHEGYITQAEAVKLAEALDVDPKLLTAAVPK